MDKFPGLQTYLDDAFPKAKFKVSCPSNGHLRVNVIKGAADPKKVDKRIRKYMSLVHNKSLTKKKG